MRRNISAVIPVLLITIFMLVGCKKTETAKATLSPEEHQAAMLRKSFEEAKKTVAAKVNGEAITMFALVREMNALAPQYIAPGGQRTPELDANIREHALKILIFQALAVQEARKLGLTAKPEAIDDEMKRIKAEAGSAEAFQADLAKNGMTEGELRGMVEQEAMFELIAAREIDAKIAVTDEALRQRYKKGKAGLKGAAHGQITFEQSKGMLEQQMRAEVGENRMRAWEQELRKNARIEIMEQKRKQG